MGEIEAALPLAPWQIVLLEKLTKYFEIFQCSVPTQCILSDTADNSALPSRPSHGDLCDFLQKITNKQNLL